MFCAIQAAGQRLEIVGMRVLQVIHNLGLAGAEVLTRDLILGLTGRGIECELYLLQSADSSLQRSLLAEGIRIHAPLQASVYSPLHVRALTTHFGACSYDIVHVHLFPAQLWVALAARAIKVSARLVTTEHSAYNYRRRRVYRPMDHWIYAQYCRIACVSDATAEALIEWLPEVAGKARSCPNGIHLKIFTNTPPGSKSALFSLPETCPVILSVGRMVHQKDHGTAIRALSVTPEAHLVLVGVGPELEKHRKLAQKLGVAHRVHFLGPRTDIPQLMKAANIFVQSSRFEGFGIAALEAMASGLPVVASRVPGLAELVGEAGLLFEAGDHHQLARHLNTLLSNEELLTRLAERGKSRATAFSFDKTLDCYETLYRQVEIQAY
jgi:glycosyltransferase involved in cell wall biosynthesis